MFLIVRLYLYISIFAFFINMIFTNNQKQTTSKTIYNNQVTRVASVRPRYFQSSIPAEIVPPPTQVGPSTKSMKWGEPTWFLFHTLAEKIKPNEFEFYKLELFEIIKTICNTLPCPDCANHATEYMSKVNFKNIRTKTDLQIMLWTFHNEVNQRKGFGIFPMDDLSPKYSKSITRNIIQHFIHHHEDKHASFRMIADDFHRKRISAGLRTWFLKNIDIFEE